MQIATQTRKTEDKKYFNIVSFATHERHQSSYKLMPHRFYLYRTADNHPIKVKDWDYRYAPLVGNHYLLNPVKAHDQIPKWLDYDLILSQNKAGQIQISRNLQQIYPVPIISIEHTLPPPETPVEQLKAIKQHLSGDINVFITNYNREKWGWGPDEAIVIPHGIDTELFSPGNLERKNHILSVANEYPQRDSVLNFSQYQRVTKGLPTCPVGNSPGFSEAAKGVDDLVNYYRSSRIFINTAHVSPIPMALLEALSCGCACVSCDASAIGEYITHGVNGFLAKNDKEMRDYLELLLLDENLAKELGQNASKSIREKCSLRVFTDRWEEVFQLAVRN